jgi:ABC-type transport system involved in multi-copper enzyme maturation permease subunit
LVAWHVFKESVRDRVLYGIGAFAVLLVAASIVIGQITAGQDVKIIKDLGLATIELAGILMTIFIGVGLVAREIDRRSIFSLLAKPIARWEFIVGKYVGLVLTILVNISMMTVALYLMLAFLNWTSVESIRASWDAPATDPRLLVAVLMIFGELALLTAVALLFSTFSSSALLSVALTVGVFVAGLASQDLRRFGDLFKEPPPLSSVVSAVGWIVPAFSAFDLKLEVVHGRALPAGYVMHTLLYAGVYVAAVLFAAIAIFSRREFR